MKSQVGRQASQFGQAPVHASRTQSLAKAKDRKTRETSGLILSGSSPSDTLQLSLASKLRANLAVNGSPEYELVWKDWTMPSGQPICALRASAPRSGVKDSTGWPTPCEDNGNNAGGASRMRGMINGGYQDLPAMAKLIALRQKYGTTMSLSDLITKEIGGALNPELSCWLMGFPEEWASCMASEIP